jgi:hypothetical protein
MRVPAPVTLAVTILTRYFLNSQKRARHVPEREILDSGLVVLKVSVGNVDVIASR